MALIPDERAFPFAWNAYATFGFTKREVIGMQMAQAMVQGLYSFQGDTGSLTNADIAKAAWNMADALVKKS